MWNKSGFGTIVCGLIIAVAVMVLLSGCEPGKTQEASQEPLAEPGGVDARSREKDKGTGLGQQLVAVIVEDDLDALERLLRQGADPNVALMPDEDAEAGDAAGALEPAFGEDQRGSLTLLHLAASLSRAKAVRLLLEHGADVHASDELGATPLHNVYDPHFALMMTQLTKKIDDAQRQATVKALLEHGADPLAPGGMRASGSMFLAKVALRHPGDLELLRPRAGEPQDLVHAALTGDVQQVQYWLRQESDHAGMQRVWATYLVARLGDLDVLRVLVESGADADGQIPETLGLWIMSPGHRGPLEAAAAAGHVAVVRYLLGQGVETSEQRFAGAAELAVSRGHREVLQVLADEAADRQAGGPATWTVGENRTLLHVAAQAGAPATVSWLVEQGVELDRTDRRGQTALHVAAQQGHDEFVKLLLEQGAAANRVDGTGRLPGELASDAGHHELAGLLEAARGDVPRHDPQELFDAIQRRDHTAVRAWFEQGGPVDVRGLPASRQSQPASGRDERGFRRDLETPLYAAVRADDATLVRLLLEQGADAEARVSGQLALEQAVSPDINLPVMQMLLERANPAHLPKLISRPLSSRTNLDAGIAVALLLHYADGHVNDQQSREGIVEAIAANEDRADVLEVLLLHLQPEPETLGELQRRAPGGRWQCGRLLETYADTEPATWQRRAAYFFALVGGDEKAVAELLAEGADPNQRFLAMPGELMRSDLRLRREASAPDVRPALHIAAVLGHVGVIEILIDKGAQINATDPLGATALQAAAHHGQTEALQALVAAGADLEQRTDVGLTIRPFPDLIGSRSPMSLALAQGRLETMEWLIEHDRGRDASQLDRQTLSGFLSLAVRSRHTELVRLLIRHGAEPQGPSVLQCAADGDVHLLRLLLEAGAEVEVTDHQQRRPLHLAAAAGAVETVRLLLEHGAQPEPPDDAGKVPQQYATQAGHDDVVALLLKAARQRAVDEPVDPARFLSAAALGDDLAVRDLLDRGADPDVRDSFGRTALHRAAFYGHRTTCTLLLEAGTGLDRKDRWGRTPLHWAAAAAHTEIVDLLLDAGASADVPDVMDRTAPAIAAERGFVDIAERLSGEGPDRFKPSGLYQRVKRAVDAGQVYYFWSYQSLLEHTDKVRFPQRRDPADRLQSPIPDYSVLHRAALENDPATVRLVLDNGGEVNRTCRRPREYLLRDDELAIEAEASRQDDAPQPPVADVFLDEYNPDAPHLQAIRAQRERLQEVLDPEDYLGLNLRPPPMGLRLERLALHDAARLGHRQVAELLLGRGSELDTPDSLGYTPVLYAARGGHTQLVAWLLAEGAQPKPVILAYAMRHGDRDMARAFFEVESEPSPAVEPLYQAAKHGDVQTVGWLIEQGLKLDAINDSGLSALHRAGRANDGPAIRILAEAGAPLDLPGRGRMTGQPMDGEPPLHDAAHHLRVEAVRALLAAGADPNLTCGPNKRTALHYAVDFNRPLSPIPEQLSERQLDVVRLLLAADADPTLADDHGQTSLHRAAGRGHADLVRLLLESGAEVNEPNEKTGRTALHEAASTGAIEVARILIDAGADPTLADKQDQSTPIDLAQRKGHEKLARLLKEAGNDPK